MRNDLAVRKYFIISRPNVNDIIYSRSSIASASAILRLSCFKKCLFCGGPNKLFVISAIYLILTTKKWTKLKVMITRMQNIKEETPIAIISNFCFSCKVRI